MGLSEETGTSTIFFFGFSIIGTVAFSFIVGTGAVYSGVLPLTKSDKLFFCWEMYKSTSTPWFSFLNLEILIGGPLDLERGFFLHSAEYNKNLLL